VEAIMKYSDEELELASLDRDLWLTTLIGVTLIQWICGGQSAHRRLRGAGTSSALQTLASAGRLLAVSKKNTNASNKDPSAEEREIWIKTAAVVLALTGVGWALFLFWPARIY
jgi:hypothetical protein